MNKREHPFRVLRGRRHIEFAIDEVAAGAGGAAYVRIGDRAVIVVAPGLTPEARQVALAHELIHDEYGVVSPPATDATMERIEHMVDREVAEWLVPIDRLVAFVARMSEFGPVEAWMVAEEYGVTDGVARRQLGRLLERELERSSQRPSQRTPAPGPEAAYPAVPSAEDG